MLPFIDCNSITSEISTVQFFSEKYFNKYIKKFISKSHLCHEGNVLIEEVRPLIFITKIESVDTLYHKILKSINRKFVLITHYGDKESGLHQKILDHPLLIKWYGQNMSIISDKTCPIPIGLESMYFKRTNINTIKKYSGNTKKKLLYLNFSLDTNLYRSKIMNILLDKGFQKNNKLTWDKYIKDLSRHKFCVSPKGNGIDCHRMWECLYLGVIPIIEKSIHMDYFSDLPILFVDSYDIVSIDYLNNKYSEFQKKSFNMDKLYIPYWNKQIRDHFVSS